MKRPVRTRKDWKTDRETVQITWTVTVGAALLALALFRVSQGRIPNTLLARVPAKQTTTEYRPTAGSSADFTDQVSDQIDGNPSDRLMKPHELATQERTRRL